MHLVGQHLGLLARFVLGLLLLQVDVPQRIDHHERHDERADEHRELETDAETARLFPSCEHVACIPLSKSLVPSRSPSPPLSGKTGRMETPLARW